MTLLEQETELLPKGSGTRFIPCEGWELRGDDGRTLEGMGHSS